MKMVKWRVVLRQEQKIESLKTIIVDAPSEADGGKDFAKRRAMLEDEMEATHTLIEGQIGTTVKYNGYVQGNTIGNKRRSAKFISVVKPSPVLNVTTTNNKAKV